MHKYAQFLKKYLGLRVKVVVVFAMVCREIAVILILSVVLFLILAGLGEDFFFDLLFSPVLVRI